MKSKYLIVLDIDGTLLPAEGRLPACTHRVLQEARQVGHNLAIITGRGLPRLREAIGEIADVFPTDTLVAVEQGTRIIELSGRSQTYHEPIPAQIVNEFLQGLPAEELSFIAFHPADSAEWSTVWTSDPKHRQDLSSRMTNATVIGGTISDLQGRIHASQPSMVIARMNRLATRQQQVSSNSTWISGKNLTLVRDVNTKGRALQELMKQLDVSPDFVLVAGDDIPDASMLRLVPPQNRLIVGPALIRPGFDDSQARHVRSPLELGNALHNALNP